MYTSNNHIKNLIEKMQYSENPIIENFNIISQINELIEYLKKKNQHARRLQKYS